MIYPLIETDKNCWVNVWKPVAYSHLSARRAGRGYPPSCHFFVSFKINPKSKRWKTKKPAFFQFWARPPPRVPVLADRHLLPSAFLAERV